jgi:hypothetical protein
MAAMLMLRWGNGLETPEEAVLLVEWPRSEKEAVHRAGSCAVAEGQCPQPIYPERLAVGPLCAAAGRATPSQKMTETPMLTVTTHLRIETSF